MQKNFAQWHVTKTSINNEHRTQFFQEREIWWCSIGLNVGDEQDGKGQAFERPVIIIKKHNLDIFLAVPVTTNLKASKYYFPLGNSTGRQSVAILSQIRLYDAKRLSNKIATLDIDIFEKIKKALWEVNFS